MICATALSFLLISLPTSSASSLDADSVRSTGCPHIGNLDVSAKLFLCAYGGIGLGLAKSQRLGKTSVGGQALAYWRSRSWRRTGFPQSFRQSFRSNR